MNIQKYRHYIEKQKGKKEQILKNIQEIQNILKKEKTNIQNIEEAQLILQAVAQETQSYYELYISEIVTNALVSIFDDTYTFRLIFKSKRGKTEAEFYLLKNNNIIQIKDSVGGGVVDIISFALRIALWKIQQPASANTVILDEPFKFVDYSLKQKIGELIKLLSEKLNIQFIIVTHDKELIDIADELFKVEKQQDTSKIIIGK